VGDLKIVVDYDECEANGVCVGIDPEIFELDDDENLLLHVERPEGEQLGRAREAVDSCPKRALFLKDIPQVEETQIEETL
jgi:ferredoxin